MLVKKIIYVLLLLFMLPAISLNNNLGSVVSSQPLATAVGYQILKQGGNAIDAAVAVGYALAVTYPCCGNIGGGGFMVIHFADGNNIALNFRETAPAQIKPGDFYNHGVIDETKAMQGYLSVGVPGTVMGLNAALNKYGTMPLAKVIQPAIDLAQNGFVLSPIDVNYLQQGAKYFAQQINVKAIFLNNGQSYQVGQRLLQPELAQTLKLIQKNGDRAFYNGPITQAIIAASQKRGGVLTTNDFAHYRVEWLQPISCAYHGYQIISAPPPSSGGVTLCEMLTILRPYSLLPNSAISTHYIIEAMRNAYYDRNHYLGDPNFVTNPITWLLSQQHAMNIQQTILPFQAGVVADQAKTTESQQTTHFAVIDRFGNAVSVTYTLNAYFGAKVIAGDSGFFLNDEMDDFTLQANKPNAFKLKQGTQNLVAPNKRPLSSMAPTIILKNKHVVLVIGAAGGSTIPTQVLLAFLNHFIFKMAPHLAVAAPRYHMQWSPDVVYYEPFAFSSLNQLLLQLMGYQLQLGSPYNTLHWGITNAIFCDSNHCLSVTDPRTGKNAYRF